MAHIANTAAVGCISVALSVGSMVVAGSICCADDPVRRPHIPVPRAGLPVLWVDILVRWTDILVR